MDNLKQLQQQFASDIYHTKANGKYLSANFSSNQLIQIYRNNYYHNLTSALTATYSCVKRLVGDEFFNALAQKYIQKYPAKSGDIIQYGKKFSNFITQFKACNSLPYLGDIAKFERYYEDCYNYQKSYLLKSKYPLIKIWQIDENSEKINIDGSGDYIAIYYQNNTVIVEKITKENYQRRKNESNN